MSLYHIITSLWTSNAKLWMEHLYHFYNSGLELSYLKCLIRIIVNGELQKLIANL